MTMKLLKNPIILAFCLGILLAATSANLEWGTSDHYIAEIIPSRAGDYSFRVFGIIGEQAIDEVFTSTAGEFSSVEPVSDVSFPDAIPSTVELLEQIEALEAGE